MRFHCCTLGSLRFCKKVVICAPLGSPISLDSVYPCQQSVRGGPNEYCPLWDPVNFSVSNSSHVGSAEKHGSQPNLGSLGCHLVFPVWVVGGQLQYSGAYILHACMTACSVCSPDKWLWFCVVMHQPKGFAVGVCVCVCLSLCLCVFLIWSI